MKFKSVIFLVLLLISACNNKKGSHVEKTRTGINQTAEEINLVRNPFFENWYDVYTPKDWVVNEGDLKYTKANPNQGIYIFKKDSEVQNTVKQFIELTPRKIYKISSTINFNTDKEYGGIYIFEDKKLIAKEEYKYKKGERNIVLYIKPETSLITIVLGFTLSSKVNKGSINPKNVFLNEVDTNLKESDFPILFQSYKPKNTAEDIDIAVINTATFVNNVLLAKRRGKSEFVKIGDKFKKGLKESDNFFTFLREDKETIKQAYDLKATLALAELLNHINISYRIVNIKKNGTRNHTYLEYYNFFNQQWIGIDMFYSAILKDVKSVSDYSPSKVQIIPEINGIYSSIASINNKWENKYSLERMTSTKMTFPF